MSAELGQGTSKGVCVNCELPILADETAAIGPKGTSHLTYKGCLKAIRSTLDSLSVVLRAAEEEGKMHKVGCTGGGEVYETECDCALCQAVREYGEVKK